MRITLRQLEIFVLTAKHHTISMAAQEAFLSQAAASMSLAQLESLLGQHLFDREGKKLKLNNLGRQILPQANNILQQVKELEQFVSNPHHLTGHIHIGASTTIANYILPSIITAFKKKYPEISIQLTTLNTEKCVQELAGFKIDIALIEGLCFKTNIELTPWRTDQLQIFCHPKHPLINKRCITLHELSTYPWILREETSGTRQILNSNLQQHQVILSDITIVNSSEAIKHLVLTNPLALGCLSEKILMSDLKSKKLVKLTVKSCNLKRQFYQAHHKLQTNTHTAQLFEKHLWSTDI